MFLFYGAIADTKTAVTNQSINTDAKDNLLRDTGQAVASSDSVLSSGSSIKELNALSNNHEDELDDLVNTSDESYEKLLAHAEEILGDDAHTETRKKIDQLTKDLDKKIAKDNQNKQHASMKETSQKADKIIQDEYKLKDDFKKPHAYYQGKSVKDYIDQNVKNYNDVYEIKNYSDLLEDIKTPERIEKTFDKIDQDEGNYQYKLKDGYPIEQITTVGLLKGQNKRLKKCLIMKMYGGGTWRTYCRPLKKPTQCLDYDWSQLDTMAIMYC